MEAARTLSKSKKYIISRCYVPFIGAGTLALLFIKIYPFISKSLFELELGAQPLRVRLIRLILVWCFLLVPAAWITFGLQTTNNWLHRHRWKLGLSIVILAVVFDLNGSSLGIWNAWFGRDPAQDVVFGTPRVLRTDEYVVGTPLAFSQQFGDYGYFNNLIGNRPADMFMIKDAPVWNIAEIFRPFHWGYFILGSSRGLAFYWCARFVFLILTAYDFMLLLTSDVVGSGDHRGMAALGASLIAFSPIVQWWFAVNNLPEMLIAMFAAWILFNRFLTSPKNSKRIFYFAGTAFCAGSFVLALYPAWQIPFAYLVVIVMVVQVKRHWGTISVSKGDFWGIVLSVLAVMCILGYVFWMSRGAISSTLSTIYPGKRHENGGGYPFQGFSSGIASMFFSIKSPPSSVTVNATEGARFFDLFPLGIALSIINALRAKKIDLFDLLLWIYSAFLMVYMVVGVPNFIAKVTLFQAVPAGRATLAFGLINILLLIRAASHWEYKKNDKWVIPLIIVFFIAYTLICVLTEFKGYIGTILATGCLVLLVTTSFAIVPEQGQIKRSSQIISIVIVVISGLFVNPIQLSSDPLTRQPVIEQASAIDSMQHAIWATEGDKSSWVAQIMVANGIDTVNAISVVPNDKLWRTLDPDKELESISNRFAHLSFVISDEGLPLEKRFTLSAADAISAKITPSELKKLGVKYVLSSNNLDRNTYRGFRFILQSTRISGYAVYELEEQDLD